MHHAVRINAFYINANPLAAQHPWLKVNRLRDLEVSRAQWAYNVKAAKLCIGFRYIADLSIDEWKWMRLVFSFGTEIA